MRRFSASIIKEILLILRDKAGMVLLFLMPVALVFIMVIIQDAAINSMNDNRIPLVMVDRDHDTLSSKIRNGILKSGNFDIVEVIDGDTVTADQAQKLVAAGTYQIGIILPAGASDTLRSNAKTVVKKSFYEIGIIHEIPKDTTYDSIDIQVFFDPSLRAASKTAISAMIAEYAVRTEAHMVYKMYADVLTMMLPEGKEFKSDYPEVINYKESYATENLTTIQPNAVQHNIPSWTLFAMFFIVIPLSSSLIKEKEEGTYLRLVTMPGSYTTIFLGKITVYLMVAIIQFFLMMMVGFYLVPVMGMPKLVIGHDYLALAALVFTSALAAIGFGVMIGTVSSTNQQASSFGAIIVMILAAIGGLFMPSYMMPASVRHISDYSPMYWAHESFQDLFIRDAHIETIAPRLLKLLVFALICYLVAFGWKKFRKVR
jgi:ABC-2 type transport system permease protein